MASLSCSSIVVQYTRVFSYMRSSSRSFSLPENMPSCIGAAASSFRAATFFSRAFCTARLFFLFLKSIAPAVKATKARPHEMRDPELAPMRSAVGSACSALSGFSSGVMLEVIAESDGKDRIGGTKLEPKGLRKRG